MIDLSTPISQEMTATPITVDPGATIGDARDEMAQAQVRHMPVVDGGRLLGIVSARDLMMLEELRITSVYQATVDRLMTKTLVTARPGDALATVVKQMVNEAVGAVLISEGDKLMGIFTDTDCARVLRKMFDQLP